MNQPITNKRIIRKLNLPKISRAQIDWQNMLARKVRDIEFSLHDGYDYSVSLLPLSQSKRNCKVGLLIEIDGVPAPLWFSSIPRPQKIKKLSGGKEIHQLPSDLRSELVEMALKPLINQLILKTNSNIRVINFLSLQPAQINERSVAFRITEKQTQHVTEALLIMHDKLIPVFKGLLEYWPSRFHDQWHLAHALLSLEIGTSELSTSELAGLEENDVILMEDSSRVQNRLLRIRVAQNRYFEGVINTDNIYFNTGLKMMNENNFPTEDGDLADIPVQLSFDLGEIEVTYQELQGITEGYVLPLNKSLPRSVTIRSRSKAIGVGDLVDIDGTIGVRISHLHRK